MSYLNFPQLHFFGKFRADPSTLNNTPDNFNPNNQFPPANGDEISNNIQLYWNPNGTAQFLLDCVVGKICYIDGTEATTTAEDPLIGMSLRSLQTSNGALDSAKVVDLDPMQQNVTEIWGLSVGVVEATKSPPSAPPPTKPVIAGKFLPAAYTNAWVQVMNGRGDYAGSAHFQSVLTGVQLDESNHLSSRFIRELRAAAGSRREGPPELSLRFVLRAFNPFSDQYLVSHGTLEKMRKHGIPEAAIEALRPLSRYMQGRAGANANPGQIPTTSYFEKLVKERTQGLDLSKAQVSEIVACASFKPEKPPLFAMEYDFTWGQAFGTLGLIGVPPNACVQADQGVGPEPAFLCPDRIMAPPAVQTTAAPVKVPTDSGPYGAYFAPFKVMTYASDGAKTQTFVTIDLGNALASTALASPTDSHVDAESYKNLFLYCLGTANKVIGPVEYADNSFYRASAGIFSSRVDPGDVSIVQTQPLGLVNLDENGNVATCFLAENEHGYYVRANQFVYRMNPGVTGKSPPLSGQPCTDPGTEVNPGTATVEFYVSRFGSPAAGVELWVRPMSPIEAQTYSNGTLGTGGTTGMVNLSVPESALALSPETLTTDEHGIATLRMEASDPGNPRGYIDGQIYFLKYGFRDAALQASYIQSPDDLISVQIYNQQPDIETVTWTNFVGPILQQYGKIYPVMSFLDLSSEESVKNPESAAKIYQALRRCRDDAALMPVTRDLSYSRLNLILRWLEQFVPVDCR
jgi:hypothetical protein